MKIPGLSTEETSDLLHWVGVIGICLTLTNVLVHSWIGKPWEPSATTLGLLTTCIVGGIANERLNPPALNVTRPLPAEG